MTDIIAKAIILIGVGLCIGLLFGVLSLITVGTALAGQWGVFSFLVFSWLFVAAYVWHFRNEL